jgi:hypothetical protein
LVNNSPFHYGPITTVIAGSSTDESASVTGPIGGLVITDSVGSNLTGNVNWVQISTHDYGGAINAALTVNVSGLTYGGANPDLKDLVLGSPASMDLTFQFSPGETLVDLTSGSGPYQTSYSGSISVIPEPSTLGLLALGFGALTLLRRKRQ